MALPTIFPVWESQCCKESTFCLSLQFNAIPEQILRELFLIELDLILMFI